MARQVDADSAETIDRIVAATRETLAERGAAGLTFRAVARRAGVSVGTIGYYFESRPALVEASLDDHHAWGAELVARLVARHGEGASLEALIEEAVRSGHQELLRDRETLRLRRLAVLGEGALSPTRRRDALEPALAAAAEVLSAHDLPVGEARLVCQSMILLVTRYALLSDDEVVALLPGEPVARARGAIEDHLVAMALGRIREASSAP
ncbi:MAG: helix-turn-helix domain-containing protein [Myxococcota bacterium]